MDLHPDMPSPPSKTKLEKILIDVKPGHLQVPDGLGITNEGGEKWLDAEESKRGNISKQDNWKKEYSEMVDTDEEENDGGGGEDWWDQGHVSDYERHFMPPVEAN